MSLRVRERVLPLNSTDFECDQSKPYISFKIAPDPSKVVDLSTMELSCFIDTNANIKYKMVAAPGTYPQIQNCQYSFHYPLGLTSFLGRLRILTASGELLEEVQNLNVLCETRKLFLDKDEANVLYRMEGVGVQTNMNAFVQATSQQGVTPSGNKAVGTGVYISQLLQTRFKFSTIGGIFAKKLMTLASGLVLEIYMAPYTNQRRLSGPFLEVEALKNQSVPCSTTATAGELQLNLPFATANAVYALTNIFEGSKLMISYKIAAGGVYTERAAFVTAAAFANGIMTLSVSPLVGGGKADLNPTLVGATEIYISIPDAKTKMLQTNQPDVVFDATTAASLAQRLDLYAHGVPINAMLQNGSAQASLYANAYLLNDTLPPNGGYDLFGVARSGYEHLPLYAGRLIKVQTQAAGNYAASEWTIRRIESISAAGTPNQTLTITVDSDWDWTAAPGAGAANDAVGMISLMDEVNDLQIDNVPVLRNVQLEFETMQTTKMDPSASIPFTTWRTEQFYLSAGTSNPFLTLSTQCENMKYVILAAKASYGLPSIPFDTVLPLYNGRALSDLPIDIQDERNQPSTEQIWMIERAMGIPVKQPNLLAEGGLTFDSSASLVYPNTKLGGPQNVPLSFVDLYQTNCIVLPGDELNLISGRFQLQFTGQNATDLTIYAFIKCERVLEVDKGKISIL